MEEKINEVRSYFKNKLLKGEFEMKNINHFTIDAIIDNKYIFQFLFSPENPHLCNLYINFKSFIDIKFSEDESLILSSHFFKKHEEFRELFKAEISSLIKTLESLYNL